MGLSDSVGGAGLAWYPQVALVLFVVTFALVVLRLLASMRSDECERAGTLPLEDARRVDGAEAKETVTVGGEHVER